MFLIEKKFIKPTKKTRTIAILENLNSNPEMSQSELGRRSMLSSAMVNKYLKELQDKKIIDIKPIDGKKYKYILTEKGQDLRRMLLGQYMAEIVQVYSALKKSIFEKLQKMVEAGVKEVILFGASATCEIVLSVINGNMFKIMAVVDSDKDKQGEIFWGYVVHPPEVLRSLPYRNILITSFAKHNEIKKQILEELKLTNVRIFTL